MATSVPLSIVAASVPPFDRSGVPLTTCRGARATVAATGSGDSARLPPRRLANEPGARRYATGIEVAGPGKFWRHDDFPGSEDAETKTLFRSLEGTVFKPLSLRKQLPIKDSDAAYAMLRYDALGTGEARREE